MKNIFAFFFLALFSVTLFAQEEDIEVSSRFGKSDRLMIDLYDDLWLSAPDTIDFANFNRGASVSLMQDFAFGSTNFSFAFGLGIGMHNLYTNADMKLDTNGVTEFKKIVVDYKINKIGLSFVDLPIELRFRTKRDNVFRIAVGGKIGYMINNHVKYSDDNERKKTYKIENINPLRYGVTARVGYKMFNAYVYYGLSTLFEEKLGPEMAPLSIGISLIPF